MRQVVTDEGVPGRPTVLVVGEALIDAVAAGPRLPAQEHVGGSPANVALGLGRLGVPVRLRTALACDDHGRLIAEHLEASAVAVDPASYSLQRTAVARAVTAADGSASYTFEMEWRLAGVIDVVGVALVHVGSIACFLEPGATTLEVFLRGLGGRVPVSFDPNIRRQFTGSRAQAAARVERLARLASIVKLSDEDARWLYPGEPVEAVLARFLGFGARLAVVTLGGGGALLAGRAARSRVAAFRVPVVDTVGAGDSFMAALLDRVVGVDLDALDEEALAAIGRHAALAASITVSRAGADLPGLAELAAAEASARSDGASGSLTRPSPGGR